MLLHTFYHFEFELTVTFTLINCFPISTYTIPWIWPSSNASVCWEKGLSNQITFSTNSSNIITLSYNYYLLCHFGTTI